MQLFLDVEEVQIGTGTAKGAGTDGDVKLTIFTADGGRCGLGYLDDPEEDNFENSKLVLFISHNHNHVSVESPQI